MGARLALSAGETSGDALAAALARALQLHEPDVELAGLAGAEMRAAGVEAFRDSAELDVMGLFEVLAHIPRIARLRRDLADRLESWPADAFIGVDSPDFNLGLANRLRRRGIFTAQLVAPSVWAWRAWRIGRIARSLDLLMTLFPFEPDHFRNTGLDVRYVGHPLADVLPMAPDREAARTRLGLSGDTPVIVLLPGSRPGEIRRHARLLADTAALLARRFPGARLPVVLAREDHREAFNRAAGGAELHCICGRTRDALTAADAAVAASGTVTLEALLLKVPMVIYYRLGAATHALARSLVRSRFVGLPNLLADEALVPERIQGAARPETLAADIGAWLDDDDARARFRQRAMAIHDTLACNAADTAAGILLERLHG